MAHNFSKSGAIGPFVYFAFPIPASSPEVQDGILALKSCRIQNDTHRTLLFLHLRKTKLEYEALNSLLEAVTKCVIDIDGLFLVVYVGRARGLFFDKRAPDN